MKQVRLLGFRIGFIFALLLPFIVTLFIPGNRINIQILGYVISGNGICLAGVFPTITLLVNSMSASHQSVKEVKDLYISIKAFIVPLKVIIFAILCEMIVLVLSSIIFSFLLNNILEEILLRVRNAFIASALGATIYSFLYLPKCISDTLKLKYHIALSESQQEVQKRIDKLKNY